MAGSENMTKLRGILRTFADLIRQGEGTDSPITVSQMRQKMAQIDISTFTIDNGSLTGYNIVDGTTDSSTPSSTLNYFEKLMTNFANKVRVGSEKLDIDDIEEEKDLVCGVHEVEGKYGLILPNSVTSINVEAFDGCTSLTSIMIPDSVTEIGEAAFYMCEQLVSVTIGKGIQFIMDNVFEDCPIENMAMYYYNTLDYIYDDQDYINNVLNQIYFDHRYLSVLFIGIDDQRQEIALSEICPELPFSG